MLDLSMALIPHGAVAPKAYSVTSELGDRDGQISDLEEALQARAQAGGAIAASWSVGRWSNSLEI
jgi:hypothetical protein